MESANIVGQGDAVNVGGGRGASRDFRRVRLAPTFHIPMECCCGISRGARGFFWGDKVRTQSRLKINKEVTFVLVGGGVAVSCARA